METIVVTGGAGFIGSGFVRYKLETSKDKIIVIDKLTYAGNTENLPDSNEQLTFVKADISSPEIEEVCSKADSIVNFAAETHVDRSISDPEDFIKTDIFGTYNLLEITRKHQLRYLQISTDEVYGSIESGSFTESSPLDPSSPYSASKAGGDMLVFAYQKTYGINASVIRASNNYGRNQYPEKLIPLTIINALLGQKIPIYGKGNQVRNWLYVEDFCRAIDIVLKKGPSGEVFNVGGPDEIENLQVVKTILKETGSSEKLIKYVKDRPGHDQRYSLNSDKLIDLGWEPTINFERGIKETVAWYKNNQDWWQKLLSEDFKEYYKKQYGEEQDES